MVAPPLKEEREKHEAKSLRYHLNANLAVILQTYSLPRIPRIYYTLAFYSNLNKKRNHSPAMLHYFAILV